MVNSFMCETFEKLSDYFIFTGVIGRHQDMNIPSLPDEPGTSEI
jgi:hypothetical protein